MTPTISRGVDQAVEIELHGFGLPGHLTVPASPRGVVAIVHAAGGSGTDVRDRFVVERLVREGIGALQFDLVGTDEEAEPVPALDLEVLAVRLLVVTRWLRAHSSARGCRVGYFGVDTGAAVALLAAAEEPSLGAVVCGAGRLELLSSHLEGIEVPTLLVVEDAPGLLDANDGAGAALRGPRRIVVVPDSGDLFVPVALETVANLACAWFLRHLQPTSADPIFEAARCSG